MGINILAEEGRACLSSKEEVRWTRGCGLFEENGR